MTAGTRRRPRISVIIPAFNREHLVGNAITSILAQTESDFELLLIDDGSTDGTLRLMESYQDDRVRVFSSPTNQGIPQSRNRGLRESRGDYVAWLDSDDISYPNRLAIQARFLDDNPSITLIGSWTHALDASGQPKRKVKLLPTTPDDVRTRHLFRCSILQYSMMGRGDVLREYGYDENFPVCQDYDLFARLEGRHKLANLPQALVARRIHAGRISKTRAETVKQKNQEIAARQLGALGMSFGPDDLDRHYDLARLSKHGVAPDRVYLDWAEDWLTRIIRANRETGLYPAKILARTAGLFWAEACGRAALGGTIHGLGAFLKSPLSLGGCAALGHAAHLITAKPSPS